MGFRAVLIGTVSLEAGMPRPASSSGRMLLLTIPGGFWLATAWQLLAALSHHLLARISAPPLARESGRKERQNSQVNNMLRSIQVLTGARHYDRFVKSVVKASNPTGG